mmetsp:Transcript_36147/g.80435  ORF Transcript_36147/g.80435 Transcript_36147/m.80435 type:complete len:125 (-) Transcript_36147:595-969(-)|eukprot:CAMPEP_0202893918 /NCGR_PEP_ID=MMETSP1392-20130828/3405_1 /ASSEMBLY_ACC=CAM_ASM_000868 /TAXON_ID=225041 /ORGANISM="Chlamydomonas chlamydogama, Strain SAG 11-48b" /LENGTH=124 /DNA_ID=CAMNT_0049578423 /DNA_START=57 /DNA_END=431 /DNA_ORIENTATION=-
MAASQEIRMLLQKEVDAYKQLQTERSKAIQTRTQLLSQAQENDMVLEELNRLDEDANVYKLIGPTLIKQDLVEAKSNVSKRLEYIKGEMERVDNQIKSLDAKSRERENEVLKLNKRLESLQQAS